MKDNFNRIINIKNLMLKDIIFNQKPFMLGIAFSLFACIAFQFDSDPNPTLALYMSLMVLFTNFIGKSCSSEEKDNIYNYLKAIPIRKTDIVLAKYLNSILVILITFLLYFLASIILPLFGINSLMIGLNLSILLISIYILYCSIYLFIFFKYNYSSAQNTVLIVFILMFIILKFFKNKAKIHLVGILRIDLIYIVILMSLVLFLISYKLSSKYFISKSNKDSIKSSFNLKIKSILERMGLS
ncbi:hypothetical protein OSSY52_19320 [Tepiditoga spiralis]|uniref:ABC-2 type transporter domain-containing protein n=1 Tax=Tepiditoga spiralis TaxID=2108365 RepID=A0A7G1G5V0_9BACT|nr:ABC-2 transporter permease [Tepiditoga spiralis]BBE31791.1 hypothetical protein OSSY52_19320 [Tepiditoga spiralis]